MPDTATAPVATAPVATEPKAKRKTKTEATNLTTGASEQLDPVVALRSELRKLLYTVIHSKGGEQTTAKRTFAMRLVAGDFAALRGDRIGFATTSGSTISAPASDWVVFGCTGRLLSAGKITDLI